MGVKSNHQGGGRKSSSEKQPTGASGAQGAYRGSCWETFKKEGRRQGTDLVARGTLSLIRIRPRGLLRLTAGLAVIFFLFFSTTPS